MKITIATCPCSWGVFYADGGASGVQADQFLQEASMAGYKQIELGPEGYLPTDTEVLKAALEKVALEVCAGTSTIEFLTQSEEECVQAVLPLAKRLNELGVRDMVVMDGSLWGESPLPKTEWTKEQIDGIYSKISAVNTVLMDMNIRMVFHPHCDSAVETVEEIERLLEIDGLMLCFDTGHHVLVNGSSEKGDRTALDFIKEHADRIPYLHFKNPDGPVLYQARQEGWSGVYALSHNVMCNLEDGIIDFESLRDLLKEIDFEGTAVIEQDMYGKGGDYAYACAKLNLEYLQRIGMID